MTACVWSACTFVHVYGTLIKASPIFPLLASKQSKPGVMKIGRVSIIVSFITFFFLLLCCRSRAQEAPSPVRGAAIVQAAV